MPQAAFILKVNLENVSPDILTQASNDIADELQTAGFEVVEVHPWDRPSLLGEAMSPEALITGDPFKFLTPK